MRISKEFLLRKSKLNENKLATAAALGLAASSMAMPPSEDIPHLDRFLQGLGQAEHRGRVKDSVLNYDPRFYIRTGGKDPVLAKQTDKKVPHSTAYGPFQWTKSTIEDLSKRHPKLFAGTEEYVGKFTEQGRKMLKNADVTAGDPTYGYGKSGELAGEEFHSQYMDMSRAGLAAMAKDLKIDVKTMTPEQEQMLVRRFRGVKPETSYMRAFQTGKSRPLPGEEKPEEPTQTNGTTPATKPAAAPATETKPSSGGSYSVVAGDNLSKIARKHGKNLADIIKANPQITDPNKIKPNDKINIPK